MRATDWPPKMHKLRFALLSVVFIALAMGVCALQAGAVPVADRTDEADIANQPTRTPEGDVPDHPGRASGKTKPQGSRSLSWKEKVMGCGGTETR